MKMKEHTFNYEAFQADPEGYVFTEEDIRYLNARELEEYELTVPMTPYEKRALRKWVASGHGVHEHPASKYICLDGVLPEPDFLDVYRMDKDIEQKIRNKTPYERIAYLKEYIGYQDEDPQDGTRRSFCLAQEKVAKPLKQRIRRLHREVFYLWMFIAEEGLYSTAREYLDEHMDEQVPFEDSL